MMQTALTVRIPLWDTTALGLSGTLTSPAIDLRRADKIEALLCLFTSVAGTASVKVQYAVSEDGVTFGAFTDYANLVTDSSVDFPTPEGLYAVQFPDLRAPWIKIKLTELTGALSDTKVTVTVEMKEK